MPAQPVPMFQDELWIEKLANPPFYKIFDASIDKPMEMTKVPELLRAGWFTADGGFKWADASAVENPEAWSAFVEETDVMELIQDRASARFFEPWEADDLAEWEKYIKDRESRFPNQPQTRPEDFDKLEEYDGSSTLDESEGEGEGESLSEGDGLEPIEEEIGTAEGEAEAGLGELNGSEGVLTEGGGALGGEHAAVGTVGEVMAEENTVGVAEAVGETAEVIGDTVEIVEVGEVAGAVAEAGEVAEVVGGIGELLEGMGMAAAVETAAEVEAVAALTGPVGAIIALIGIAIVGVGLWAAIACSDGDCFKARSVPTLDGPHGFPQNVDTSHASWLQPAPECAVFGVAKNDVLAVYAREGAEGLDIEGAKKQLADGAFGRSAKFPPADSKSEEIRRLFESALEKTSEFIPPEMAKKAKIYVLDEI